MNPNIIHLDTNYLVNYVRGTHPNVSSQIHQWLHNKTQLDTSAMAWAEFLSGTTSKQDLQTAHQLIHNILPITANIATSAANLMQYSRKSQKTLADCIIAATAIHHRAHLATLNQADFTHLTIHGLQLT